MDPRQTLIDLLESIAARDYDGASDAFENLTEWLRKGGYMPEEIQKAIGAVKFS